MIDINEFLLPKSVYVCPVCGEKADDYEACQSHIKNHSKPGKIISYSDGDFPEILIVKMSDDRLAQYRFESHIAEVPEE